MVQPLNYTHQEPILRIKPIKLDQPSLLTQMETHQFLALTLCSIFGLLRKTAKTISMVVLHRQLLWLQIQTPDSL